MDLVGFGNTKIRKKLIEWEESYLEHGSIYRTWRKGVTLLLILDLVGIGYYYH